MLTRSVGKRVELDVQLDPPPGMQLPGRHE
jgi:hypothetical protein